MSAEVEESTDSIRKVRMLDESIPLMPAKALMCTKTRGSAASRARTQPTPLHTAGTAWSAGMLAHYRVIRTRMTDERCPGGCADSRLCAADIGRGVYAANVICALSKHHSRIY